MTLQRSDEFLSSRLRGWRGPVLLYLFTVAILFAVSGKTARKQSSDPHFVVLAHAWLQGRTDVTPPPGHINDWARVEVLKLTSGKEIRGRTLTTDGTKFQQIGGEIIEKPAAEEIAARGERVYVSFPPFPSVLMLPGTLIWGRAFNDVAFTILLAGFAPALLLIVLRRLRERNLGVVVVDRAGVATLRGDTELYTLALILPFGTLLFYSSIIGQVWFTAHVVGVVLALLYVLAAIEAKRPMLAGLALGCAFLSRTPMLFMAPLFLFEAWRVHGGAAKLGQVMRSVLLFSLPIALLGIAQAWFNQVRFGSPFEFGHSYLFARQQSEIERWGLFHLHYLGRNLAAAFALIPQLQAKAPYVRFHGHGLSLLLVSPILLYAVWPRAKGVLHSALWLTVLCVAVPIFLYQNSGWVQFGFRFSLDFTVFLLVLVALSGRALLRPLGIVLVIWCVAINAFGAHAFAHKQSRYFDIVHYENLYPTTLE